MLYPTTHPPIALDPQHVHRPWARPEDAQHETVAHWEGLLDRGLIGGNPPMPDAVRAQAEANEALFRGFARDRWRLARGGR